MPRVFTCALSILLIIVLAECSKISKPGILGIEVPTGDGKVTDKTPYRIMGVFEDSPAYNAGIRPGDIIVQINSIPLKGQEYGYIYRELLLGKAGTKVILVIERDGIKNIIDVVRAEMQ